MATNPASILIVDDDPKIRDLTSQYLIDQGLNVHSANGGKEMDTFIASNQVSLIILDLMMPGLDGLEVCKALRARGQTTPILMLTALDAVEHRIAGLDAGVIHFDAALAGIGGCPYAPGATGNICTEDLIHALEVSGYPCGVDLDALIETAQHLAQLLGHPTQGQVMKAGRRLRGPLADQPGPAA